MRVKHSAKSKRRKKKILKLAKGYWGSRSKQYRRAVETVRRGLVYAYRDRRMKKREFRSLWITRIGAAAKKNGLSYRILMHDLKKKEVILSRDILAKIASEYPEVFDKIVDAVKNN